MVGRQVGHYRFVEKLGSGGMGEIYKAQDDRLQRFVAIKVLSAEKAGNADIRRRFLQEAQAASALNHPNIITIYDILSEGDTDFMVLEFVAGVSLAQLLRHGPLPAEQAINQGVQVAGAVWAAHTAGIVHRDLKPGNVMVTADGRIKVLDFGLAKLTFGKPLEHSGPDAPTEAMGPMTVEGSVIGTINYMSPEQAEGKQVDGRSDIFSFGLLLYEMITGRRGFECDSVLSTLTSILRDEVRPIPEFVPNAPPRLQALINRCLKKKAEDRWQSMQEVHAQLAAMKAEMDSAILAGVQPLPGNQPLPRAAVAPGGPAARKPAAPGAPAPAMTQKGKPAPAGAKPPVGVLIAAAAAVVLLVAGTGGAGVWWYLTKRETQVVPEPASPVAEPAATAPDTPPVPPPQETLRPAAATPGTPPAPQQSAGGVKQGTKSTAKAPISAPAARAPSAAPAAAEPAPKAAATTRTVTLADGLPVSITLNHDIAPDAAASTALHFTVAQDFRVGGVVAIAKGATVVGEIVEAGKKRFIGGTKMTFRLTQTLGADGSKIKVRATPGRQNVRPVETPVKAKGKDLAASSGTAYIAYIDGAQTITVRE